MRGSIYADEGAGAMSVRKGIIGVVQARMGSQRLPGKSLTKVYRDWTLIEMVLLRVLKCEVLEKVILATSVNKDCDPLAEKARALGVEVYRGNETDVLSRFIDIAKKYQPRAIVRICADNPLIAFDEMEKLVYFFDQGNFDYAGNHTPECGLPDGLGCEMIRTQSLLSLEAKPLTASDREHVTDYFLNHPVESSLGWHHTSQPFFDSVSLDIDTEEDLQRMREFLTLLPVESAPYWTASQIIATVKKDFGKTHANCYSAA